MAFFSPRALIAGLTLITAGSTLAATTQVEVLQSKLDHPWSLAFLPENQGILITLKDGQLKRWQPGAGLSDPINGVPDVWANG